MFKIKIGQFSTEISISPKRLEAPISEILSGFTTTDEPDIILEARLIDELRYNDYKGPAPAIKTSDNIYRIKWYYFSGTFDTKNGYVSARINSRPYVLTSLLRMVYAIKAVSSGGLFVHAASFVRDNKAYLFPGKSGAGKSTLLKIAVSSDPDIEPLSDEISYIAIEKGRPFAYSTPFWGNTKIRGHYIKAPLRKIFFIRQSAKNYKRRTENDETIKNMLENSLYASVDRESFMNSFETIKKIVAKTENSLLFFTKDSRFLEVI
ncbi:MAG: hypothetical protein N3B13_00095 [Deltaproteobacteria bacterium]|nr:hypothetical protein [Deltaproteobacteria bacterium]